MMVLIGLISDTHIPDHAKELPGQLSEVFRSVDLILHCGDIYVRKVLDELESIVPVIAAWGDDDLEVSLGTDTRMMKGHTLFLDGVTPWLTHVKPRYELIKPKEESHHSGLNREDSKDHPNVVVFGHTHLASIERYNGVLLVNPGSATFPNYVPKLGTVARLSIGSGNPEACIVQFE